MPEFDDAISYLIEFTRNPPTGDYAQMHGYDIWLPHVVHHYMKDVLGVGGSGYLAQGSNADSISTVFYDVAWELVRRGIFRPGLKSVNHYALTEGAAGNGYCITPRGRTWLEEADETHVVLLDPSRFARLVSSFRDSLGDGFLQRAQEADRCHFGAAYLACCAMSGAAAESILLRLAIAKSGDESQTIKTYRAANGRRKLEDAITGQLRKPLADQFKTLLSILGYWRDEAAHGGISEISEIEAHVAMSRLLRLAQFAKDHWDELTN